VHGDSIDAAKARANTVTEPGCRAADWLKKLADDAVWLNSQESERSRRAMRSCVELWHSAGRDVVEYCGWGEPEPCANTNAAPDPPRRWGLWYPAPTVLYDEPCALSGGI
jgi:hypothetical protein